MSSPDSGLDGYDVYGKLTAGRLGVVIPSSPFRLGNAAAGTYGNFQNAGHDAGRQVHLRATPDCPDSTVGDRSLHRLHYESTLVFYGCSRTR
jgi:hypothetical protein